MSDKECRAEIMSDLVELGCDEADVMLLEGISLEIILPMLACDRADMKNFVRYLHEAAHREKHRTPLVSYA